MKKTIAMLLAVVLCLSATGCCCISLPGQPEQEQLETDIPEQPTEELTEPPVPATLPPTDPPTEPITEPIRLPLNEVPYTTQLSAARDIHNGPGNDYTYTRDVGLTTIYTIVEEKYDSYGNLWGKLKSGIGWVQLSGRLPESNYIRTCLDCGRSEPDTYFSWEYESEYCENCSYGKGNGGSVLFCWQCGADCTYRGVEEDGRCEDCYYGN